MILWQKLELHHRVVGIAIARGKDMTSERNQGVFRCQYGRIR